MSCLFNSYDPYFKQPFGAVRAGQTVHLSLCIPEELGYVDPQISLTFIENGHVTRKVRPDQPKRLVNVIKCTNPRCITSLETGCDHIFALTPSGRYRCVYCEQEFKVRP